VNGYIHEYKDFPGPGEIRHANHALQSNSSRIFFNPKNNVRAAAAQPEIAARKMGIFNLSSVM